MEKTATKKIKTIREIKVDVNKCTGCRTCEMACSAFHAAPRYSSSNPGRSRIVVIMDELNDVYVPVRAGGYAKAECSGRNSYTIDGKKYSECSFCPASCSARDYFKEPDSGLPLKCDMCGDEKVPKCVEVCLPGALTYEVREEEIEDGPETEDKGADLSAVLEALMDIHGTEKVMNTFSHLVKS